MLHTEIAVMAKNRISNDVYFLMLECNESGRTKLPT